MPEVGCAVEAVKLMALAAAHGCTFELLAYFALPVSIS